MAKNTHADISAFVKNVQKFNALQFNARTHLLITTFGEVHGLKYTERYDKYGMWFFIHELPPKHEAAFYDMVLNMD
jgi:hypothetical protein